MSYDIKGQMKKARREYVNAAVKCTKFAVLASCYALVAMPIAFAYMNDLACAKKDESGDKDDSK